MNKKRLLWEKIRLELKNPFRVAYIESSFYDTYWVRLAEDNGWGECAIPSYFNISEKKLVSYWEKVAQSSVPFPVSIHQIDEWMGEDGVAPARCAVELALLDRIGREDGKPLHQVLDLPDPKQLTTSYSISLSTPQEMAEKAKGAKNYPILKVKLGGEADESCIAAIREVRPDCFLRVDVNGAWDLQTAQHMIKRLSFYNVEFVEQPLPRENITELGILQSDSNIPIIADESARTLVDIHKLGLAGIAGVNLKLMKVGGILTTMEMIKVAREYNMRIMLGCMLESSLGVTAMAHLSGEADWIDLDAPMLLKNDPFEGLEYDKRLHISLPDRPGIGVIRKE